MTHRSFKILLSDAAHAVRVESHLHGRLGAVLSSRGVERDRLYHLFTNTRADLSLKLRDSFHGVDAIFEQAVPAPGQAARFTRIGLAHVRNGPRDTPLADLLGPPDLTTRKERAIFTSPKYDGARFYLDIVDGQRYFELQVPQSAPVAWEEDILSALDLNDHPRLYDSYAGLALRRHFAAQSPPIHDLAKLPESLLDTICARPRYRAKTEHRLLRQGDAACNAFLIESGEAIIRDGAVTLGPGQLVGEFGIVEGVRSDDVAVSKNFSAYMLPAPLVRQMLVLPAFSRKYMDWKLAA